MFVRSHCYRLVRRVSVGAAAFFIFLPVGGSSLLAYSNGDAASAASPGASVHGGVNRARLDRCLKAVLGVGRGSATPVSGSAAAQVVAGFSVFRRTRSGADALPAAANLGEALAAAGARTYDPSAAVRLTHNGGQPAAYAVPATVSVPTLPVGCDHLPQFAGVGAYLALQTQDTGSGPGACLIWTQVQESPPLGPFLPGMPPPKPVKTLAVAQTVCKSEAVLSGYVGALGGLRVASRTQRVLIPDGVSALTYTLSDGHHFTVGVTGNLATPPAAALSIHLSQHPTAAELRRQLAAHLPTTVTETGTGGHPTVTLTRPVTLIPDTLGYVSFLRHLLQGSGSTSSSGSSTGASCSARTHRCVAVTVTTTCDASEHCHTTRTIHRYRYVGAKPPPGTTGPNTQPTAPIVARTNRLVTRPRKLTLVLSGTPQRHVVVLLSVSCFARNSAAASGGPPLQVPVPSRTAIALPGPGRAFHACDVGALVTSTQRSRVHITIARG